MNKAAMASFIFSLADEDDAKDEHSDLPVGDLATSYQAKHDFMPGDEVRWKPGMKFTTEPAYGQACVVLEVLDPPVYDTSMSSGSPYWRQPLDVRLGYKDKRGSFLAYHFDGSRYEPVE